MEGLIRLDRRLQRFGTIGTGESMHFGGSNGTCQCGVGRRYVSNSALITPNYAASLPSCQGSFTHHLRLRPVPNLCRSRFAFCISRRHFLYRFCFHFALVEGGPGKLSKAGVDLVGQLAGHPFAGRKSVGPGADMIGDTPIEEKSGRKLLRNGRPPNSLNTARRNSTVGSNLLAKCTNSNP